MAGTQTTSTGFGRVEVAVAVALSGSFVALAVAFSPLWAAAVVVPLSIAAGRWRAHAVPQPSPHSLSEPVYSPTAVVLAPKVSESAGGVPEHISAKSATTAA